MFSKPAHEVEETHPLLMRAAHRVAERYLLMPAIVQRIREVGFLERFLPA